jgi:nicotinamidase/pyrazinamidase
MPDEASTMSTPLQPGPGDALLIVDVQQDFLPGGALGVPRGDEVVGALNRCIGLFHARDLPIVATRDWHPADHCSFKAQGGPWPVHCVADTGGAAFATGLALPRDATVISKATTAERDAYSGFQGTDLAQRLRAQSVRRVFVGGLATDYCVLHSALDAAEQGLEPVVLLDAIRAVEISPGDGDDAIRRMREAGARTIESNVLH